MRNHHRSRATTLKRAAYAISIGFTLALTLTVRASAAPFMTGEFLSYPTPNDPYAIASQDLDRDGFPDLVVVRAYANVISTFHSNGDGTLAQRVDYATVISPSGVLLGDINEDGYVDAVVSSFSDSISVC